MQARRIVFLFLFLTLFNHFTVCFAQEKKIDEDTQADIKQPTKKRWRSWRGVMRKASTTKIIITLFRAWSGDITVLRPTGVSVWQMYGKPSQPVCNATPILERVIDGLVTMDPTSLLERIPTISHRTSTPPVRATIHVIPDKNTASIDLIEDDNNDRVVIINSLKASFQIGNRWRHRMREPGVSRLARGETTPWRFAS